MPNSRSPPVFCSPAPASPPSSPAFSARVLSASAVDPTGFGQGDPFPLLFTDQGPLELGERDKNVPVSDEARQLPELGACGVLARGFVREDPVRLDALELALGALVAAPTRPSGRSWKGRRYTVKILRLDITTWIERTYHRRRRQRRLGKLTPIEYETINRTALTAASDPESTKAGAVPDSQGPAGSADLLGYAPRIHRTGNS